MTQLVNKKDGTEFDDRDVKSLLVRHVSFLGFKRVKNTCFEYMLFDTQRHAHTHAHSLTHALTHSHTNTHAQPFSPTLIHLESPPPLGHQVFAAYCGLALHNAQLHEQVRRDARRHQVALEMLSYHTRAHPQEVEQLSKQEPPQ